MGAPEGAPKCPELLTLSGEANWGPWRGEQKVSPLPHSGHFDLRGPSKWKMAPVGNNVIAQVAHFPLGRQATLSWSGCLSQLQSGGNQEPGTLEPTTTTTSRAAAGKTPTCLPVFLAFSFPPLPVFLSPVRVSLSPNLSLSVALPHLLPPSLPSAPLRLLLPSSACRSLSSLLLSPTIATSPCLPPELRDRRRRHADLAPHVAYIKL